MILVTGGTGLLGSHLLFELVQGKDKIRATKRETSNLQNVLDTFKFYAPEKADELFQSIEWVEADMMDLYSLNQTFKGVNKVYHTAASVSFNSRDKYKILRNNIEGTANLVNLCLDLKVEKLCYVSSTAAIGASPNEEPLTENLIWSPGKHSSTYAVSKFKSEMQVWRGIEEGLNAVIVNPSIIIGSGSWGKSSARLFSAVWKGMKYYTYGVTGYVDVWDVVKAMIMLTEKDIKGERFIVSAEDHSYKEILDMIADALGKPKPSIEAKPGMIRMAVFFDWLRNKIAGSQRSITREAVRASRTKRHFSNEKIRSALGIEFTPIQESVQRTAKFFLEQFG